LLIAPFDAPKNKFKKSRTAPIAKMLWPVENLNPLKTGLLMDSLALNLEAAADAIPSIDLIL
jgi:hypothetical protein